MEKELWWKQPMRVLQFNLQVEDTQGMDAEKIARETEEMAANVAVMNVGGIYAWYQSHVRYHHVNEFLPKDRDLLEEWIEAFHKRNIRFVARFDFSITDDRTYLEKPQWFARHKDKSPYYRGEKRMGNWNLLLNTCAIGGYRNEEVGVPVIEEVLDRYAIDGIFLNAPFASACFCERCQKLYQERYHKPMPDTEEEFESDWLSYCTKLNIKNIYDAIKKKDQDLPLILYYAPYSSQSKAFGRFDRDNIYDRYATADLICTESQNVLSKGMKQIPETTHPMISMKAGQREDGKLKPFGIIHSCPGMDWRHVGLPVSEYLPWMCQIPAAQGTIWHSVTGYNDTITDKRVIQAITQVDHMIEKCEEDMHGAVSNAEVLLLWNGAEGGRDWADILMKNHIQFDLMHDYCMNPERMKKYKTIVWPEDFVTDQAGRKMLDDYVTAGGSLLAEMTDSKEIVELTDLFGVEEEICTGEYLTASYLRFEKTGDELKKGMSTDRVAFRGSVSYCIPKTGAEVLATLIPPFAPLEVVGAPPERASLPVKKTEIPLCVLNTAGRGKTILVPFCFHRLCSEFHMKDHYDLARNMIAMLCGGYLQLETRLSSQIQISIYRKEDNMMIHLVNEIGERPLMDTVSLTNVRFRIHKPNGKNVISAKSVIAEGHVRIEEDREWVEVVIDRLDVWDMIKITWG